MGKGPAEAFPVGDYITEELESRGWTQQDLAAILGRPVQFVSEVITGKKELTRESAAQVGAAFGTSAEVWLNLQTKYQLWLLSRDDLHRQNLDDVELRARLRSRVPIAELRRRGVVTGATPVAEASQVCALLGIESLESPSGFRAAARRSNASVQLTAIQETWLACANRAAMALPNVAGLDRMALRDLAAALSRALPNPESFVELPQRFAAVGVKLVYVEAFSGSKIDGAAFVDTGGSFVTALSGRGKRFDKALFTLLHECAHLVLGHVDENGAVIDDLDDADDRGARETEADRLAGEWAIPGGVASAPGKITAAWLSAESMRIGVNPIVLAGRLQKEGVLPWRSALVKNAPTVIAQLAQWSPHPRGSRDETPAAGEQPAEVPARAGVEGSAWNPATGRA